MTDFEVYVRPGARRTVVEGWYDDLPVVRVAAPPADGAANLAVVDAVAAHLGTRRSCVTIAKGSSSRRKLLRLTDERPEVVARLVSWLATAPLPHDP